jgi:hypothetical protein
LFTLTLQTKMPSCCKRLTLVGTLHRIGKSLTHESVQTQPGIPGNDLKLGL